MGVFKEIAKADGSGTTTFYRLSSEEDTVETTSTDGTSTMIDYNSMLNKPSINDVALVGNKTLEDLGIQPAGDYLTAVPEEYITEEELEAKDYATEAFVMEQINNTEHFHREIVDALPLTGKDNVLYLVPKKGSDKDIYNEYIWTGADYEFMGTTAVDLTDYYQKNEVDELLDTKVNKVSGKQLSTNDYTTAEKTKLASLENYDDSELRSKVDSLHNYDDTAIKLDIQELKRDTSTNEIDITSIENELGYKAEVIRLVKNGDWWLCQDAKGNNLTLEMAMNRLGLPKTILLLENLENDGKYYPVEYELQEKYIDIIYKDLDGITHHLNYGYNEYFTNTASGDYIHLEDSINYPYKKLEVDGVCGQETTSGKNKLKIKNTADRGITTVVNADSSITVSGTATETIAYIDTGENINFEAGTYTFSIQDTLPLRFRLFLYNGSTQIFNQTITSGNKSISFTTTQSITSYSLIFLDLVVGNSYNFTIKPMLESGSTATEWEKYTGGQPSPNPDYPQEIKTIENSLKITSCNKNLFDYKDIPNWEVWTQYAAAGGIIKRLKLKPNTDYTMSSDVPLGSSCLIYFNGTITELNGVYLNHSITKTTDSNGNLYIGMFKTRDYYNDIVSGKYYVKLQEGATATPYEQHLETQITANLPMGEFIGKINNTYKDTLKVEYNEDDGQHHLKLYKNVGKVVLNGTEGWGINQTTTNHISFYLSSAPYKDIVIGKSDLFGDIRVWDGDVTDATEEAMWSHGNGTSFGIKILKSRLVSEDVAGFKQWLSENPVTVYYELAEPYEIDLGIVDMPITYNEITNLFTDSNLMPTMNIEYYTAILENAKDTIIGQDIYLQNEVDNVSSLPTDANKGDIRKVKDTESWYIYDGTIWSAFDKASEIDLTNYLSKDNTIPYAPSTDYNPATKRYVDTKVDALFIPTKTSQLTNDSGFVLRTANDLTNYYNKSNTYNKAEVNALVAGGGGGSNVSITVNGDTLVITTK